MGRVFSVVTVVFVVALVMALVLLATGLFSPFDNKGGDRGISERVSGDGGDEIQETDFIEGQEDFSVGEDKKGGSDGTGFGGGGGGGGGNGGGGAGGDSALSPPDSGCVMRKVSYALRNFAENSTCNLYSGENCVDKTVDCSVEVQNLDSEITGLFEIRFDFFNEGGNLIDSVSDSQVINPGNIKTLERDIQIIGEDANNNIDCTFNSEQVPEREVCLS